MAPKILVGYRGSSGSDDALCLAKGLAALTGAVLVMTDVESGASARGLQEMAEADSDDLIVVPASFGVAVLHGAPCPVAVAPRDLAEAGPWKPKTVGLAYDGSAEAQAALEEARRFALAARATLKVIAVAELIGSPQEAVDPGAYRRDSQERAHACLREARAALSGDLTVTTEMLFGDPRAELLTACGRLDLFVLGSRAYGRVRRVLLGSVSAHLAAHGSCPLVITPRGSAPGDATARPAGNYAAVHGSPRRNPSVGST